MAAGNLVGVDHPLFLQRVGDAVGPHRLLGSEQQTHGFECAVGSAVEHEVHVLAHEETVPGHSRLHADDAGVARVAGDELLARVHDHLHRPTASLREHVTQGDVHEVALAAEVSPDRAGMDEEPVERRIQRGAHLPPQRQRGLAARPDLRAPVRQCLDDARVRLEVTLMNELCAIGPLDDQLGLSKTLDDVALRPTDVNERVGGGGQRVREALITHHLRVNERRRKLHGLQRIKYGLQLLVLDVDEIDGLVGYLLRGSRHRGHLFAREADDVIREDGHVPDTASDAPAPQLSPGDDGLDTLQLLRPARIDSLDSSVGNRAPQDLAPQHPRQGHVTGVSRPAGDLVPSFGPRDGPPYMAMMHCHRCSPAPVLYETRSWESMPDHPCSCRQKRLPPSPCRESPDCGWIHDKALPPGRSRGVPDETRRLISWAKRSPSAG